LSQQTIELAKGGQTGKNSGQNGFIIAASLQDDDIGSEEVPAEMMVLGQAWKYWVKSERWKRKGANFPINSTHTAYIAAKFRIETYFCVIKND
jgi:hypothetical protein